MVYGQRQVYGLVLSALGSGLGVWLFLTGGPEKESAIAKQRDKAKRLKEILIAKKKELRDWEQTKPMPLVAEI